MMHLWFALFSIAIAAGLFIAMVALLELGRRLGVRQKERLGPDAHIGAGLVDNAVYGLLALLIGFTFSGAAERFDQRREFVADEVNMAGTAWQRIDLLPPEQQDAVRDDLRRYVDALYAWYSEAQLPLALTDQPIALTRAQDDLWARAVAACLTPAGDRARMLLLPALNDVFGAVEKERMARRMHPPIVIWLMLGVTALTAALLAGYGLAGAQTRSWIYVIGLAASVSIATYVIIELEYPRLGLFRVNAIDQSLVELRATMN